MEYICELLGLKIDTVQKAIRKGRIIVPDIQAEDETVTITKRERNLIDDSQEIGKACSNVSERILSLTTGANCEIKFSNQNSEQLT